MSQSDELSPLSNLTARVREQVERILQAGEIDRIPAADITNLVTSAVKLYAAAVEEDAREVPVIDGTVSTTEAIVMACALMRAHQLNPFDLALWFSHSDPNVKRPAPGASTQNRTHT
jgi:hypothetical protein